MRSRPTRFYTEINCWWPFSFARWRSNAWRSECTSGGRWVQATRMRSTTRCGGETSGSIPWIPISNHVSGWSSRSKYTRYFGPRTSAVSTRARKPSIRTQPVIITPTITFKHLSARAHKQDELTEPIAFVRELRGTSGVAPQVQSPQGARIDGDRMILRALIASHRRRKTIFEIDCLM